MGTELNLLITIYDKFYKCLRRYALKVDYERYTKEYESKNNTSVSNGWWAYPMEEESQKVIKSLLPEDILTYGTIVEVDNISDIFVKE